MIKSYTLANIREFKDLRNGLKYCSECGSLTYIEDTNRNECYCNNCGIIHDFKPKEGREKVVFT